MSTSKISTLIVTALLAALMALGGCSGQSTSSQAGEASSSQSSVASESVSIASEPVSVASESAAEPEPEVLEIGKDSSKSLTVTFTNKMGKKITDIAAVPSGTEEGDVDYLMAKNQEWPKNEKAIVHFKGNAKENFDVYVKAKGDTFVMHNLAIGGVDAVTLRVEGEVGYATFKLDGSEVNSLADEVALIEQKEAERAAAEAEQAAAEAEQYVEEEVYYEDYDEPAQTEDTCVEGGVQLR